MKRRNIKNGGSYDKIQVITPSKLQETHEYSLSSAQVNQSCISPLLPHRNRGRHYLQLPKIHHIHANKKKKADLEQQMNNSTLHNRLLLLGHQYNSSKKEGNQSTKNLALDKKEPQYCRRKKKNDTKQSLMGKRFSIGSMMHSLGIEEIGLLEKKRINVYLEEGNNSRMIKEILRRRPQFHFVGDKKLAQLVWTRFCDHEISKLSSKVKEEKMKALNKYETYPSEEDEELDGGPDTSSLYPGESNPYGCDSLHSYRNVKEAPDRESEPFSEALDRLFITDFRYHNHLTHHYQISDKKSLCQNLKKYCGRNRLDVFSMVPVTFQINSSHQELPNEISEQKSYFIKPGEDTNRGHGISIARGRASIREQVNNLFKQGKTALVQEYIEPLLYRNRKFDIRCFVLVLSWRGKLKVFWYKEGYVRTCCKEYSDDIKDQFAHLTNDAIQKKSSLYGKYEQSNKLSFGDLELLLRSKDLSFRDVYDSMKKLVYHSIKCAQNSLTGEKNQFNFQIFGYDFLLDKKGKAWLIEINTNPCLQFTGSLTSRIIWHMMDNSMRIFLDPFLSSDGIFCTSSASSSSKEEFSRIFEENKYQCLI